MIESIHGFEQEETLLIWSSAEYAEVRTSEYVQMLWEVTIVLPRLYGSEFWTITIYAQCYLTRIYMTHDHINAYIQYMI